MDIKEAATSIMTDNQAFNAGLKQGKKYTVSSKCPYTEKIDVDNWELGYRRGCEIFNERQWQKAIKNKG
jgi:hypothetical protein